MGRVAVSFVVAACWVTCFLAPAGAQSSQEGDLYDCSDFDYQEDAQEVFDRHPGDPYGLDGPPGPAFTGIEGVACEGLPHRPDSGGGGESTTPAQEQYSPGGATCDNARTLATLGPEVSDDKKEFQTTGDRFLVTYEVDFESDDPLDFRDLEVDIIDRFGLVEFDSADRDTSKSFVVVTESGRYAIETDVTPNNGATYTATVQECLATGGGPGGSGNQGSVNNPGGVAPGTTSRNPLPDTGGLTYAALGRMLLLGAALVVGRGVLRR